MVRCGPQSVRAYLFSASLVDGLEVLVNPLSCVLCGFPAFSDMGEIIIVLALHTNGFSHHLWPCLRLWRCQGRILLLKCLWVLENGKQTISLNNSQEIHTSLYCLISFSYSLTVFRTFCFMAVNARALLAFIFFLASFSFARAAFKPDSSEMRVRI